MTAASVAPGTSAQPGRRFLASLVDWILCLLVPSILAGLVVPRLWVAIVPLGVVAYFAFFLARGRTPGMRAASIRIVDQGTRRAPSAGKALARSLAALLQAAAWFALLAFAFSDTPNGGYSAVDFAVVAPSGLIALSSLVAHLWLFFDQEQRTLLDSLFGLAVES